MHQNLPMNKIFHYHGAFDLSSVVNPKVRNMIPGYNLSQYEFIFISDCHIEAEADTITDVVSKLEPSVAAIHQIHFFKDSTNVSLGYILNKVLFGGWVAKMAIILDFLHLPAVVSAALLVRKSVLEECGGMSAFGQYLAEDFQIGKQFDKKGYKCLIGDRLAWQNPAHCNLYDTFNRIIRWKKLRHTSNPLIILVEPITQCFSLGTMTALAASHLFPSVDKIWLLFLLVHCCLWLGIDFVNFTNINVRFHIKFSRYTSQLDFFSETLFQISVS